MAEAKATRAVPRPGDSARWWGGTTWRATVHVNEENAKVDTDTRNNMIKHYDDGQRQMYAMLRGMATKRGLTD